MRRARAASRLEAGDGGFVTSEWVLATALLLVPITLLVIQLPTWTERLAAGRKAANESAREVVLAPTWGAGVSRARQVTREITSDYGFPAGTLGLSFTPGGGQLQRGMTVTARVNVRMPLVNVPLIGRFGAWTWTVSHAEHVDDYRSF